ncbi:MAG: hypothetical protein HY331_12670 [Chloroflexi bacterium]|nr:hypothetical protein [Chloroflexota bacterium]
MPPKVSELLAEEHGMFDTPTGLDKAAYQTIISRESGTFKAIDGTLPPDGAADPENYSLPFFDVDHLAVPYLPDPIAAGAAFAGLPGLLAGTAQTFSFATASQSVSPLYPSNKVPFRLLLRGDGATGQAPSPDLSQRVLHVYLPPGETATVRLSCYLDAADLDKMGIWQWLNAQPNSPALQVIKTEVRNKVTQGKLWMLTPFREVQLVHAVQQPLNAPDLEPVQAVKQIGNTFAYISANCTVHGKSTNRLDVVATWKEKIDALAEPAYREIDGTAQVYTKQIQNETLIRFQNQRHDFGDTKYRLVTYTAVGTSRFQEYFPPNVDVTRPSPVPRQVAILNSARPAAPKVLYVVPIFGWQTSPPGQTVINRKRLGGGLRVYLERPWFSSGDGEQLGVVCMIQPPGWQPANGVPPELQPYVTQWGRDATWDTPSPGNLPMPTHFTRGVQVRTQSQTDITLAELANRGVLVVGHDVHYDEVRQLWYSDLQVDPGDSYFPFIRLALARVQPSSVDGAHLSRVVQTDFVQLAPDREATIWRYEGLQSIDVRVEGISYWYTNPSWAAGQPGVEVTVQTRDPDIGGELGWKNGASYPLTTVVGQGSNVISTGRVPLPHKIGEEPMRLVIQEYEKYTPDTAENPTNWVGRVIYADTFEI